MSPTPDRWYCASCGLRFPREATRLFVTSAGDLQHEEADGTASCGPVVEQWPNHDVIKAFQSGYLAGTQGDLSGYEEAWEKFIKP